VSAGRIARNFEKTPGRPLTDQLAQHVREYILAHGFKPGDRLPGEHVMAQRFKVSRPTLREAIKALAGTGLLESRPRTGTRVREFSYQQVADTLVNHFYLGDQRGLREILEAREMLELGAVPLITKRITAEQIDELRAIEAQFERAMAAQTNYNDLDLTLHERFLQATGNQLMASMVGLLRAFFAHPLHAEVIVHQHLDEAERALTIQEHRLVIEALAARDAAKATDLLREHFERQIRWLDTDGDRNSGKPADAGREAGPERG
jgi:GntR family transcriptional repressor for pyruvate dehydrogenase complex